MGWAKRGPTGLIGTNRADSKATVEKMIEDRPSLPEDERPTLGLPDDAVSWSGWQRIDAREVEAGQSAGKVREKFVALDEMLDVLDPGSQ